MNGPPRCGESGVLLAIQGTVPIPWRGEVVHASAAGPLCTQRPERLTVWAPGESLARAFRLLAMFKSAAPENCLVLTDREVARQLVPSDIWVAAIAGRGCKLAQRGDAPYVCADLRSERIFRLLLSGRVRRHPELQPLLDGHALLATPYGAHLLEPWQRVIPVLFAAGLERKMEEGLRAALEELAAAARAADHAVTGGFHTLDEVVRGPADWADGARRYLPLAAARSREALVLLQRWLESTGDWECRPGSVTKAYRETAAIVLHLLADDPWLPGDRMMHLLGARIAA